MSIDPMLRLVALTLGACGLISGAQDAQSFLHEPTPVAQHSFGDASAVDAGLALVGGPGDNAFAGEALVFRMEGSTWVHEATLPGSTANGSRFGWSCDLDRPYAIVGARADPAAHPGGGAAFLYRRNKVGVWSEEARLLPDLAGEATFGTSVAISGERAAVGAPYFASGVDSIVQVYERNARGAWVETAFLQRPEGDYLGAGLAMDGDLLVAGAPGNEDAGVKAGAAFVYRWDGTSWNQEAELLAPDGWFGDEFGHAVAVSGGTIVVGAEFDGDKGPGSGSVYVFDLIQGVWTNTAKLRAGDGTAYDFFGASVALDGARLLVGAPNDDTGWGHDAGTVHVFERIGGVWFEKDELMLTGYLPSRELGGSVGIDPTSACVIAGAPGFTDSSSVPGAYVYCTAPSGYNVLADLDILCCLPILDPAGPVEFVERFANPGTTQLELLVSAELLWPDGTLQTVVPPEKLVLQPGKSASQQRSFSLPQRAPAGNYVLTLSWNEANGSGHVSELFPKEPGFARFR